MDCNVAGEWGGISQYRMSSICWVKWRVRLQWLAKNTNHDYIANIGYMTTGDITQAKWST